MIISKSQRSDIGEEIFVHKAIQHLRKYHSSFSVFDDADARQFVLKCKKTANEEYHFFSERAVMTYILACLMLGQDFPDHYPDFSSTLTNTSKSEQERIEELNALISDILKNQD